MSIPAIQSKDFTIDYPSHATSLERKAILYRIAHVVTIVALIALAGGIFALTIPTLLLPPLAIMGITLAIPFVYWAAGKIGHKATEASDQATLARGIADKVKEVEQWDDGKYAEFNRKFKTTVNKTHATAIALLYSGEYAQRQISELNKETTTVWKNMVDQKAETKIEKQIELQLQAIRRETEVDKVMPALFNAIIALQVLKDSKPISLGDIGDIEYLSFNFKNKKKEPLSPAEITKAIGNITSKNWPETVVNLHKEFFLSSRPRIYSTV